MAVNFYEQVDDNLLKFAVIVAKYKDKFVFCKHKERTTLEIPGGHREPNEAIEATATRELQEETGAVKFQMTPVCVYSVTEPGNFDGQETFGMLYFAEIFEFEEIYSEIEKIVLLQGEPGSWTYPTIQPYLLMEVKRRVGD